VTAYYSEHDAGAAAWLRELIADGQIPAGHVDDRDILDVCPNDLAGYTHCHFFAGIGGWALALRLAGWPDNRPVWTGSCPCQSFSAAGAGRGFVDERHLWPAWFDLIARCRPPVVFGEQVEAAIGHGWLDLVQDDLEGIGYAVAPVGLPAACIGAPHARQRLWFVADTGWTDTDRCEGDWRDIRVSIRRQRGEKDHEAIPHPPRSLWADQPRPPIVAHGISASVELVCGYGNAIVPQVAAEVIAAYMEIA
jgi:DNA (cytosine-5)-methyltransferase 1